MSKKIVWVHQVVEYMEISIDDYNFKTADTNDFFQWKNNCR